MSDFTGNLAASEPPGREEADRRLTEGLTRLDAARAESLQNATLLQRTQAAAAARERDRLRAKYGAAHPRVRQAEARVRTEVALADAVATQAEEAATPPPPVDPAAWVVQGRVLHKSGEPAPGLTVSLAEPGGSWERATGYICTDARGAFALRHKPGAGEQFQLLVSDQGKTLLRDTRTLTPTAGQVDSCVLVLEEEPPTCPPPDGGTGGGGQGGTGGGLPGRDVWTVRGRVTHADGTPAADVIVSLFDEDLIFDDRLGQTTTDANGEYRLTYCTSDFRDLIERRPDLYVKILDRQGRTLCRVPTKARAEAGREQIINVRLPETGKRK